MKFLVVLEEMGEGEAHGQQPVPGLYGAGCAGERGADIGRARSFNNKSDWCEVECIPALPCRKAHALLTDHNPPLHPASAIIDYDRIETGPHGKIDRDLDS
jgi:hypothetical protein